MDLYDPSLTEKGEKMRAYNRKKEFIGWVSKENGNLTLSKNADKDILVSEYSKSNSLYSLMHSLLFWLLAGEVLSILGFAVILNTVSNSVSELPSFWMISSGNLLYMAPIGFLIQFIAILYVSLKHYVFLPASLICTAKAVLAILVEFGTVRVDWTVFLVSLSLALTISICFGCMFCICLRDDLPTLAHRLSFLPILLLIVYGTSFGAVLFSAISFQMYPLDKLEPADIIPYFGLMSEGDTPGIALFFYQMTKILLYAIGYAILQLLLKKEDRK